MTKADIINEISRQTGLEKMVVQRVLESFMDTVKSTMMTGESVYMRGFGSFIFKHRAEKRARNITRGVTITIPAHTIPAFKPAKSFVKNVKENN